MEWKSPGEVMYKAPYSAKTGMCLSIEIWPHGSSYKDIVRLAKYKEKLLILVFRLLTDIG